MDLKLFVLSDLHAFDGSALKPGDREPSYVNVARPAAMGGGDPITDLKAYLAATPSVKADYLICGGDLGDKATPIAIERAWHHVHEIGRMLGVKEVISTVGNHDIDSRHKHNDHDARGLLLELAPAFPFQDEARNLQFWTHHFATFDDAATGARFVVVNSSAYHGEAANEYDHGRVSARTLKRFLAKLKSEGPRPVNVLVCHHHPQKHSELKRGDYDDMRGGYDLLSGLNAAEFGPWLVIHGHKHHPKLSYAQGPSAVPLIFSAGSAGVVLDSDISLHAKNQVYLTALETGGPAKSSPRGLYYSWDWAPGLGWNKSRSGSGLPAKGGFGFRGDLPALAQQVADAFPRGEKWSAIQASVKDAAYLIPDDLAQLRLLLKRDHKYSFEDGSDGTPFLIEK